MNEQQKPLTATLQYGKSLENNLRAAKKRAGTTSDPPGEQRAIRDATVALNTFNEVMSRLVLDYEAVCA